MPSTTSRPADCEPSGDPSAENPSDDRTPTRGWKLARQFAGWGLLALGAVGLALPVMPGWIFIAWGAVILAPDVPFIAWLLDRLADKVPQLRSAIEWARGDRKEKHSE